MVGRRQSTSLFLQSEERVQGRMETEAGPRTEETAAAQQPAALTAFLSDISWDVS